jgi:hypothetical protein
MTFHLSHHKFIRLTLRIAQSAKGFFMKQYDLSTEKGQQAYFDDRLAILNKYNVQIEADYSGKKFNVNSDCARFSGMSLECLKELIENGFADPNETQNDSPDIASYVEFLEQHSKYSKLTLHGYIITPTRSDVRVSVEGLEGELGQDDLPDFAILFRYADEFSIDTPEHFGQFTVRCWYD